MKSPEVKLDPVDLSILDLLGHDARSTYADIGNKVGLSSSAVKRRVARLEDAGVIQGYTIQVDHAKLGRPIEAFVELRFAGNTRVDDIASIAQDVDDVEAIFTIAGNPDALAWIRVRDVNDLKRVVDRLRGNERISGTKTLIVLGTARVPIWDRR